MLDISNVSVRRKLVQDTIDSPGWGILMEEATELMNNTKDRLLVTPADDIVSITKLQTQYKTLDKIINIAYEMSKEG